MRTLLTLILLTLVCGMAGSGCGGPDQSDNPNFNKAAYDDVDAASKGIKEDNAVSH